MTASLLTLELRRRNRDLLHSADRWLDAETWRNARDGYGCPDFAFPNLSLGAGTACLVFIPATNALGAPSAVLLSAAIASIGGALFAWRERRWIGRTAAGVAGLLVASLAANLQWNFYDVRMAKGRPQENMLAVAWNSFSRVEVRGGPEMPPAPRRPLSYGLSAHLSPTYAVREISILYDAGASVSRPRGGSQ